MDDQSLTVRVLEQIRDEIRVTNSRVDLTNSKLDALREDTNSRLDFLAEGQVRLRTEVTELKGEVTELKGEVTGLKGEVTGLRVVTERNGARFENFLATEGDVIRDLKVRVTRVESHLGLDATSGASGD